MLCRLLRKAGVAQSSDELPNYSPEGEANFVRQAHLWWSNFTGAPAFCAKLGRPFANRVVTDGFSASVVMFKKDESAAAQPARRQKRKRVEPLEDSQAWVRGMTATAVNDALRQGHHLVGVDPGRRAIFTAATYSERAEQHHRDRHISHTDKYSTSSWSAKHWHEASGTNEHKGKADRWLQERPQLKAILLATPSHKTSSVASFCAYIAYKLEHAAAYRNFYGKPCHRKLRRKTKMRRQAALQKACNVISKGSKDTVVAYGDAHFSHRTKGLAPTPTSSLRAQLARTCKVVDVDEFRTSVLCCACHQPMRGMPIYNSYTAGELKARLDLYSTAVRVYDASSTQLCCLKCA